MDIWNHLASGDVGEASKLAADAYNKRLSGSEMINLCACKLWSRDWESAFRSCRRFIDSPRWSTDSSFKFSGTAKWCAGDREAAVAEWKQGIDVDYADMGGGITIPLYLYFAAAVEPALMPMDEAIELLRSRIQVTSRNGWPVYLAKIVLGEMTYEDGVEQSKEDLKHFWGDEQRQSEEIAKQEIEFWWGVKLLTVDDTAGFLTAMKNYRDLDWADFDKNKEVLVGKLRSPEFYLARCEAERIQSP